MASDPKPPREPVPPTRVSPPAGGGAYAKAVHEAPQRVAIPSAKAVAGTPVWGAILAGAVAGGFAGGVAGIGASVAIDAIADEPVQTLVPDPPAQVAPAPAPADAPGWLTVRSHPEGASVRVDGRAIGTTPIDRAEVMPGRRRLALQLEGYEPHESVLEAKTAESFTVDVTLSATEDETEEPPARRRRGGLGGGRGSMPRRDCDGERSACMRGCDDATFSCRSSCTCGVCTTDRTWEDCNRECNQCRQGCEQNESFCERQCEAQASSCRASL